MQGPCLGGSTLSRSCSEHTHGRGLEPDPVLESSSIHGQFVTGHLGSRALSSRPASARPWPPGRERGHAAGLRRASASLRLSGHGDRAPGSLSRAPRAKRREAGPPGLGGGGRAVRSPRGRPAPPRTSTPGHPVRTGPAQLRLRKTRTSIIFLRRKGSCQSAGLCLRQQSPTLPLRALSPS